MKHVCTALALALLALTSNSQPISIPETPATRLIAGTLTYGENAVVEFWVLDGGTLRIHDESQAHDLAFVVNWLPSSKRGAVAVEAYEVTAGPLWQEDVRFVSGSRRLWLPDQRLAYPSLRVAFDGLEVIALLEGISHNALCCVETIGGHVCASAARALGTSCITHNAFESFAAKP